MALTIDLQISAQAADGSFAKIKDETVYGAPNQNRVDSGNYLFVEKIDIDGQVVSDVTPSVASGFLTILEWQFNTVQDGHYQFTYMLVPVWDPAQAYLKELVADDNKEGIVYLDSTSTFYRCIADDTGTTPDGNISVWEVLTEATISRIKDNTGVKAVITYYHQDGVFTLHEKQFVEQLERAVDNTFCRDCKEFKEIEEYEKLGVLLDGAYSLNEANKSSQMEEISRYVEDKYIIK